MEGTRALQVTFALVKWIAISVVLVVLIHFFVATVYVVSGISMMPNFLDKEVVIASRLSLWTGKIARGDPTVLKFPGDEKHDKYIKRVVGIPGDTVEVSKGKAYINGRKLTEAYLEKDLVTSPDVKPVTLGPDEYWLMGDNRPNSNDSRAWGIAPKRDLIGVVRFVVFPFSHMRFVIPAAYPE